MRLAICAVGFTLFLGSCGGGGGGGRGGSSAPTSASVSTINIAGNYDLTITASASCASSLPAHMRVRTYRTTMVQDPPVFTGGADLLTLNADGAQLGTPGLTTRLAIGSIGGSIMVSLAIGFSDFIDQSAAKFDVYGMSALASNVAVAGRDISGPINGTIQQIPIGGGGPVCSAADHRFTLHRL